jgi:hypothetical protein
MEDEEYRKFLNCIHDCNWCDVDLEMKACRLWNWKPIIRRMTDEERQRCYRGEDIRVPGTFIPSENIGPRHYKVPNPLKAWDDKLKETS